MHNLTNLNLNYVDKIKLNQMRRDKILNFLAITEWSTADNLTLLLGVKHIKYTRRILDTMVKDYLISKGKFACSTGYRMVYFITTNMLLELGYEVKKLRTPQISQQNFFHSEQVQKLQIIATQSNHEWVTEKMLIQTKQYKSYPDGLVVINNQKISIELQRNRYSLEGLKNKITKCLADCLAGKFSKVLFVCVDNLNAEVMRKALYSVTILKGKNHQDIHFSEEYKAYFEFINFDEFQIYLLKLV